eukprot:677305-Prymnesium_polylepis.2
MPPSRSQVRRSAFLRAQPGFSWGPRALARLMLTSEYHAGPRAPPSLSKWCALTPDSLPTAAADI